MTARPRQAGTFRGSDSLSHCSRGRPSNSRPPAEQVAVDWVLGKLQRTSQFYSFSFTITEECLLVCTQYVLRNFFLFLSFSFPILPLPYILCRNLERKKMDFRTMLLHKITHRRITPALLPVRHRLKLQMCTGDPVSFSW